MGEHDDDLESEVHEGAEKETEGYPDTGDELDEQGRDIPEGGDEDPTLDDDEAEL
jgi:hypothetical protein